MDAINVPSPPRFTPINRLSALGVKLEKSTAAGTLEITWDAATLIKSGFVFVMDTSQSWKAGIRPKLPINT